MQLTQFRAPANAVHAACAKIARRMASPAASVASARSESLLLQIWIDSIDSISHEQAHGDTSQCKHCI